MDNRFPRINPTTKNLADEKFRWLAEHFPEAVTESYDGEGRLVRAIDKEKLMQDIAHYVVDGPKERYQFTWPGKKEAILKANAPIARALRPCREESVDFDKTGNLYIEGDNLDVLKSLREVYLGKVKMIYIDPPYNTGNDFVYEDDFTQDIDEYKENNGQYDEYGNRLVKNTESNGRFHTDWLNMIYPRLKISRDFLTDDGIIFISINDHEVNSLKNICNEIFGEHNYIATLIWDKNHSAQAGIYKVYHEYILVYAKHIHLISTPQSLENDIFEAGAMKKESGRHSVSMFTFPKGTRFDAPDGTELKGEWGGVEKVKLLKGRMIAKNHKLLNDVTLEAAYTQISQMHQYFYGHRDSLVDSRGQKIVEFYFNSSGKIKVVKKRGVEAPQTTCRFGAQGPASVELAKLFHTEDSPFDAPKPLSMIKDFVGRFTNNNDIVMDFFAGSSTTAHGILEINCSSGSIRKYILIQIQENLDETLRHASKDGKKSLETAIQYLDKVRKPHILTEIGKERIRLAGKKIRDDLQSSIDRAKAKLTKLEEDQKKNPELFGGAKLRSKLWTRSGRRFGRKPSASRRLIPVSAS